MQPVSGYTCTRLIKYSSSPLVPGDPLSYGERVCMTATTVTVCRLETVGSLSVAPPRSSPGFNNILGRQKEVSGFLLGSAEVTSRPSEGRCHPGLCCPLLAHKEPTVSSGPQWRWIQGRLLGSGLVRARGATKPVSPAGSCAGLGVGGRASSPAFL